ncbi:MAG: hypothetical protein WC916_05955 [Candidatus Woesearchaeota archaeon]
MDKKFIIDYDDTLAPNQHDYSESQLAFIKYVIDTVGPKAPDVPTIIAFVEEIDAAAVEEMKFAMERFPLSFVTAYRKICEPLGIVPTPTQLNDVYTMGMLSYSSERWEKNGLFPGVAETLDFLTAQEDELVLLTKGDSRVQEKKIAATGVKKWFKDNIFIVPSKSKEVLLEYAKNTPLGQVYHIGNSIRSDVKPALEARMKMIYIPLETWAYEKNHNGVSQDANLITLSTFKDIIKIYEFL